MSKFDSFTNIYHILNAGITNFEWIKKVLMLFIFHKKVGRLLNFLMNLELQNIWDQIIW